MEKGNDAGVDVGDVEYDDTNCADVIGEDYGIINIPCFLIPFSIGDLLVDRDYFFSLSYKLLVITPFGIVYHFEHEIYYKSAGAFRDDDSLEIMKIGNDHYYLKC
jgi:hypothetical protein